MAEVSQVVLDRMSDVHQASLSRIQIAAESAAMSAWFALNPDLEDAAQMAIWSATFWNITKPATDAVSAATYQYMSAINAYVGVSALLQLPSTDWFRDDFEGWVISPFTMARGVDGDGQALAAGAHVSKLVSATTRQAEQEAFNQIVDSPEWGTTLEFVDGRPESVLIAESIEDVPMLAHREAVNEGYEVTQRYKSAKRWKRVTQLGACGWCSVVAQQTYSDKARNDRPTGAWHSFCRCSFTMMTADESRKFTYADKPDWRDIIDRRADVPPTTQGDGT